MLVELRFDDDLAFLEPPGADEGVGSSVEFGRWHYCYERFGRLKRNLASSDSGAAIVEGPSARILAGFRTSEWDTSVLNTRLGILEYSILSGNDQDESKSGCHDPADGLISWVDRKCADLGIELGVARIDARDSVLLPSLENHGYRIMDTIVMFAARCSSNKGVVKVPVELRREQIEQMIQMARKAFTKGHFHADVRIGRDSAERIYARWVADACGGIGGRRVFVAEREERVQGFVVCRVTDAAVRGAGIGAIELIAVRPEARGKGFGRELMDTALGWFSQQAAYWVVVGTQIDNGSAIGLYQSRGFGLSRFIYTLHKWY